MKRFTRLREDGQAVLDAQGLESGEAAARLKAFEDFYEHLLTRRQEIPAELEALRREAKVKTVRFRELKTEQMMNGMIMDMLGMFGVRE